MFGGFRTQLQEAQDGEGISMKEKDEERATNEQDGEKASNCELKKQDGEVSSSCKGKDQVGKSSCFVEERIKIVVEFLERNRRVDSSTLVQYLDKEHSVNSGENSNILNSIGSEELRGKEDTEMNNLEKIINTKDGLDLLISKCKENTDKESQNSRDVSPSSPENNQPIMINTTEEGIRKVLAASALLNLKIPSPILSSPNLSPAAVSPSTSNGNLLTLALAKTVPRRQRGEKKPIPEDLKDGKYFERRKRNNLAAKKSRDQRKIREDQICNRADSLEKENAVLRVQVCTLRDEASSLRALLLKKRLSKKTQYSGS